MSVNFYSPPDMSAMARYRGAACGHGALAAAIRCPVVIVCEVCFAERLDADERSVGMMQMESALVKTRAKFTVLGRDAWPKENGLVILQWTGPWPRRVDACYRHWVAVREGFVWDSNIEEWKPRGEWEEFLPELMPKRATGWFNARGYEVTPVNSQRQEAEGRKS